MPATSSASPSAPSWASPRRAASPRTGSGDFAIAFSTAKENRVPHNTKKLEKLQNVNVANDDMTPIFMATIEATEEAVVNSLFKAKDVKGYNGKVTKALPVDQVLEMLKAEGKIVKQPR